ncbi:DUF1934 domain-containing protein [Asaccharospora irregularis]|uniref:Uncharacterized beta-barrel protein YwiB, DUF1934 family n=1 Tax=Asaccharospora irregularis DSM 2635 TaxID=1121321 RepID=A0A1M5LFR2_9FIRM|nr:DUF1934 domain-containing protein [Asaccharospora irregularis]SHG63805.1 Uncharacterized beta-barrel protein YwiB, DUF1934 family [Asaccharospora irregularis DSM 2635]
MCVKINIKTTQYDNNGNKDIIKISSTGKLYEKNGDIYILYKEEETGISNTIKVSDNQVSIKRFGNINSNMVFKNGEKNITKYRMQQGIFLIETYTNNLHINIYKNKSMKIYIDYNIKIKDIFEGRNEVDIEINI